MIRTLRRSLPAVLAFAALVLGACSDNLTGSRSGRVSILLTDAPGDVVAAVVTIDQIYLQPGDEGDAGRVILRDEDVTTDLLTLANDTEELVTGVEVPEGSYTQLRFVLSGAYLEVENEDGTTSIYASSPDYEGLPDGAVVAGQLHMPSLAQSGLKVKLPGDVLQVAGNTQVLLVDFDVARSFGHQAGPRWVMHPVLEATSVGTSADVVATLTLATGVVLPNINGTAVTLAGFSATLTDAADVTETVALTDPDANGTFEAHFNFLTPGQYSLNFRAPSDSIQFTTDPTRPVVVTLGSGESTTRVFSLTAATK